MQPEPELVLFIDASLGQNIVPEALRLAGVKVVAHDEEFAPGTPDTDWLQEVGRKGWIVLTKDKRIRYREIEKQALQSAGVAAFVFAGSNRSGVEIGDAFVKALPAIRRLVEATPRPFIASVTASGGVNLLFPPKPRGRTSR